MTHFCIRCPIFCFTIILFSSVYLYSQHAFSGNYVVTGTLKSNEGTLLLGTGHMINAKNTSTTAVHSSHPNQTSLQIRTSEDELTGSIFGWNAAFGLRDKDHDWFISTYADLYATISVDNNIAMRWHNDGKVVIGDVNKSPSGYKLFVEDGILSESLRVAVDGESDWADFVFDSDFELMALNDVKEYIDKNKHLPNVPSAEEMVERGLDVLESDAILLRKIEEAYLYILEQQEQMVQQQEQITKLSIEIDNLKNLSNEN